MVVVFCANNPIREFHFWWSLLMGHGCHSPYSLRLSHRLTVYVVNQDINNKYQKFTLILFLLFISAATYALLVYAFLFHGNNSCTDYSMVHKCGAAFRTHLQLYADISNFWLLDTSVVLDDFITCMVTKASGRYSRHFR